MSNHNCPIQRRMVQAIATCFVLVPLVACGTDTTTVTDAGTHEAVTRAPDGAVIACGGEVCDGPVVTPVATLEVCCAEVGPGGFGPGGGCGLTDPPPFGQGQCAPLKGPGVLDDSCPDILRPLQTYKGCCTPQGLCGGFANQLFGYTVNYGCGVEDMAGAQPCTPPTPTEAQWKADPEPMTSACEPSQGDCSQECGCEKCPEATALCMNQPGCWAIVECAAAARCTGADCLGPCAAQIGAHPNSTAAAVTVIDCVTSECATCLAQ